MNRPTAPGHWLDPGAQHQTLLERHAFGQRFELWAD